MRLPARILCATAMALCAAVAVPATAQTVTNYSITGTAPSNPSLAFNGTFSLTQTGSNYSLSAFNAMFAGTSYTLANTGLTQFGGNVNIGGTLNTPDAIFNHTNDFFTDFFHPFATGSINQTGLYATSSTYNIPCVNFKISAVSAVPEPATWALMLLGFGGIGYSMRRRKAQPTVSFA